MSVVNDRGRGDLMTRILVETPTRLSKEQKALLEQFRDTETGDECPASKGFFGRLKSIFDGWRRSARSEASSFEVRRISEPQSRTSICANQLEPSTRARSKLGQAGRGGGRRSRPSLPATINGTTIAAPIPASRSAATLAGEGGAEQRARQIERRLARAGRRDDRDRVGGGVGDDREVGRSDRRGRRPSIGRAPLRTASPTGSSGPVGVEALDRDAVEPGQRAQLARGFGEEVGRVADRAELGDHAAHGAGGVARGGGRGSARPRSPRSCRSCAARRRKAVVARRSARMLNRRSTDSGRRSKARRLRRLCTASCGEQVGDRRFRIARQAMPRNSPTLAETRLTRQSGASATRKPIGWIAPSLAAGPCSLTLRPHTGCGPTGLLVT